MSKPVPDKPKIYLAVILPMLCFGGLLVIVALIRCFAAVRGIPMRQIPNVNGMLISLPAVLLWIPIILLLSNLILFAIPYLRRIAGQYVATAKRPGFRETQSDLLKLTGYFAIVCLPLIALGFWL